MKSTDVIHVYEDGIGTTETQLVPTNVRCRLLSVQLRQKQITGTAAYLSVKLLSGGSGGTSMLQFGYRNAKYTQQVLNLPSHGILFEEGIYLDPEAGPGSAEGLDSITITYQG